jgi:hypothetical protein
MKWQIILAASVSIAVLSAADFWKAKDASQWDSSEVQKMLTKSPWAKKVSPEMPGMVGLSPPDMNTSQGRGRGGSDADMSGADIGRNSGAGGRRGRGGGGDMGPAMAPSMHPVIVRWESSVPMQAAEGRSEWPARAVAELAKWSEEYYVVSLAGLSAEPSGRGGREPDGGAGQAAPSEPQFRALSIRCKGKPPVKPDKMVRISTPSGPVYAALFSRKNTITEADGDVTLESVVGRATIRAKFKLKDMNYRGKLEL